MIDIHVGYVPEAKQYGIQCDAYRIVKHFPRTYKDLQKWLRAEAGQYYTPFRVPAFEEGFDWGDDEKYTGVLLLTTYRRNDSDELMLLENLVVQSANVHVMNAEGSTINKIRI